MFSHELICRAMQFYTGDGHNCETFFPQMLPRRCNHKSFVPPIFCTIRYYIDVEDVVQGININDYTPKSQECMGNRHLWLIHIGTFIVIVQAYSGILQIFHRSCGPWNVFNLLSILLLLLIIIEYIIVSLICMSIAQLMHKHSTIYDWGIWWKAEPVYQ